MHRSSSVRSKKSEGGDKSVPKHRFTMSSLRGMQQPELSKRLYKLIKTENHAIGAYQSAAGETHSIASQLSDWGESTEDDAVSEISDKLGVLLAEIAEQEDLFAQNLEDSRSVLKQIRNTESSVQPSRNHKAKIQDEIQKLKYKEPESTKLVTLEQELVRAEAQSLVAEAQLTNVTRQKFKEAYDLHTAAIIERAEKQIVLATQARHLLNILDDNPIVPGEERPAFAHSDRASLVLNEAERQLKHWSPSLEPVQTSSGRLGANAMPGAVGEEQQQQHQSLPHHHQQQQQQQPSEHTMDLARQRVEERETAQAEGREQEVRVPYPTGEGEGGNTSAPATAA